MEMSGHGPGSAPEKLGRVALRILQTEHKGKVRTRRQVRWIGEGVTLRGVRVKTL